MTSPRFPLDPSRKMCPRYGTRPPTDVSLRGSWLPHWATCEGLQHFVWERKGCSWLRKWRPVAAFYRKIFWPNKVFDPRRSPRHARRVQPRGAGEGETEVKVAAAVLQFKEKSIGVREPVPHAWRNQVGFFGECRWKGISRWRAQKTMKTEVL